MDCDLVKLSRESYINLNLVYRFDGQDMVGRTINLIDGVRDGSETVVAYKVDSYFEDAQGLVGYGFVPTGKDSEAPPRLVFRGTNSKAYKNQVGNTITPPSGFIADNVEKVGKKNIRNSKERYHRMA